MKALFILCILAGVLVEAQSSTVLSSLTPSGTRNPSLSIESLPSITPFQIPPGVLQGLGLPLVIPPMEQAPRQQGAKGAPNGMARPSPANVPPWAAPPAPGMQPGRQDYRYGTQGGLPYDRSEIEFQEMDPPKY
jgi:hypothetical protein